MQTCGSVRISHVNYYQAIRHRNSAFITSWIYLFILLILMHVTSFYFEQFSSSFHTYIYHSIFKSFIEVKDLFPLEANRKVDLPYSKVFI